MVIREQKPDFFETEQRFAKETHNHQNPATSGPAIDPPRYARVFLGMGG